MLTTPSLIDTNSSLFSSDSSPNDSPEVMIGNLKLESRWNAISQIAPVVRLNYVPKLSCDYMDVHKQVHSREENVTEPHPCTLCESFHLKEKV